MIAEETFTSNFGEKLWALTYDQSNAMRPRGEVTFYANELKTCDGPVLEIACGTGVILLEMMKQGIDIHGLDLNPNMLSILYSKAETLGINDIHDRISMQNMIDFSYKQQFDAIIIPARSFLHLSQQQDQIDCLRNIHAHIRDGGKLLLNFFNPMRYLQIISQDKSPDGFAHMGTYKHPVTGEDVGISFSYVNDIPIQLQNGVMRFTYRNHSYDYEVQMRWTFKEEFQLLLRLAGFSKWELYGNFSKKPFSGTDGEMIWKVWK